MLVFRGTTVVADATASGPVVGAPMALAIASERPWSTAANTATAIASSIVWGTKSDKMSRRTYADAL